MENLIIYPENKQQLQILKSFLEEMKIRFESEKIEELTNWQRKLIEEGLNDVKEGSVLSSEEVHKRALECFK